MQVCPPFGQSRQYRPYTFCKSVEAPLCVFVFCFVHILEALMLVKYYSKPTFMDLHPWCHDIWPVLETLVAVCKKATNKLYKSKRDHETLTFKDAHHAALFGLTSLSTTLTRSSLLNLDDTGLYSLFSFITLEAFIPHSKVVIPNVHETLIVSNHFVCKCFILMLPCHALCQHFTYLYQGLTWSLHKFVIDTVVCLALLFPNFSLQVTNVHLHEWVDGNVIHVLHRHC